MWPYGRYYTCFTTSHWPSGFFANKILIFFTYQIVMSLRRWVVVGLNQSRFLSIALMTDLRISLWQFWPSNCQEESAGALQGASLRLQKGRAPHPRAAPFKGSFVECWCWSCRSHFAALQRQAWGANENEQSLVHPCWCWAAEWAKSHLFVTWSHDTLVFQPLRVQC